jgi:hypothetical protein
MATRKVFTHDLVILFFVVSETIKSLDETLDMWFISYFLSR